MHYLAGLLIAVSVLLSGTQAFAYDNKDGLAAVSYYDDPQQNVYYVDSICTLNSDKIISAYKYENMDNTKITTAFGDIKIASLEKFIIDNKTAHRLEFELLNNNFVLSGAFIVKSKNNNKIIGSNSNIRTMYFNSDTNKITFENKTYNKKDLVITTINGTTITVDEHDEEGCAGYKIALQQGKYACTTIMNGPDTAIWFQFGLAGRK